MANAQQVAKLAYALIDFYVLNYKSKFNREPQINRFRNKYGFQDMINDIGFDDSKKVIELYISGSRNDYSVNDLLYSYDKLHRIVLEREQDEIDRAKLREETKRRVEEWNRVHGQC